MKLAVQVYEIQWILRCMYMSSKGAGNAVSMSYAHNTGEQINRFLQPENGNNLLNKISGYYDEVYEKWMSM